MNIALPALVVFLLLLPGFIFRSRFKRAERISLDYSPFGQVVTEAVLWVTVLHVIWLITAYIVFGRFLDVSALLRLISSDASNQAKSIAAVSVDFKWIAVYFITLLIGSYAAPKLARYLITKYKLDRANARFSSIFRFHQAPWYYLLTGADFEKGEEPDLISISAIVDIAGEAILYIGILEEFFVDSDGQLDRIVLQQVMRRPITADKDAKKPDAWYDTSRFYEVDGDYFVLRYSEAITLNVQYVKLADADSAASVSDKSGATAEDIQSAPTSQ